MNKQRRKELNEIKDQLETLAGKVEDLQSEEQEYFDNMPEGLQGGDRGADALSAVDGMQTAYDSVHEAISALEEAIGDQ